ncbi:MAG: MFS transporter [Desulfovibrionaceae bacterium]
MPAKRGDPPSPSLSERPDDIPPDASSAAPLPPAVRRLGWISFWTDIASEMTYPVVPLFLVSVLGAPALALGAVEGVAEAVVSLMKGASGWASDRIGRRAPFVRLGYAASACAKPLLALAAAWPGVLAARSLDRLGKGLRTSARDALLADAVPARAAGRAYGFHRAMDTAGAMVGAMLALALLHWLPGRYRTIFLLAALPGAAAVWLTLRLREARPAAAPRPAEAAPRRRLPAGYWRVFAPLVLFALANSSDTFLLLRARDLGLSDAAVLLAYVLYNAVYAATAYPLGALSDRWGRWRMILAGWGLYAAVYAGFAAAPAAGVWALFPLYGVYMGLTEGVGKALIADQAPPDQRGRAIGLFQMSLGFSALASSLAAGALWDLLGPAAPFWAGGGMAALAALALVLAAPWRSRPGAADRAARP